MRLEKRTSEIFQVSGPGSGLAVGPRAIKCWRGFAHGSGPPSCGRQAAPVSGQYRCTRSTSPGQCNGRGIMRGPHRRCLRSVLGLARAPERAPRARLGVGPASAARLQGSGDPRGLASRSARQRAASRRGRLGSAGPWHDGSGPGSPARRAVGRLRCRAWARGLRGSGSPGQGQTPFTLYSSGRRATRPSGRGALRVAGFAPRRATSGGPRPRPAANITDPARLGQPGSRPPVAIQHSVRAAPTPPDSPWPGRLPSRARRFFRIRLPVCPCKPPCSRCARRWRF